MSHTVVCHSKSISMLFAELQNLAIQACFWGSQDIHSRLFQQSLWPRGSWLETCVSLHLQAVKCDSLSMLEANFTTFYCFLQEKKHFSLHSALVDILSGNLCKAQALLCKRSMHGALDCECKIAAQGSIILLCISWMSCLLVLIEARSLKNAITLLPSVYATHREANNADKDHWESRNL